MIHELFKCGRYISLLVLLTTVGSQAMVFDNRFLPLIQHPYITNYERWSHFSVYAFAASGDQAFGRRDDDISISELFGKYNIVDLFNGLAKRDIHNPLPADLLAKLVADDNSKILWTVQERIKAQGCSLSGQYALTDLFSVGFYWGFMRVSSGQLFFLDSGALRSVLDGGEINELLRGRRRVQEALGLCGDFWADAGMCDLDAYIRFSTQQAYVYKFRHIIAGLRVGVLAPTGVTRSIDYPSSIPFGGNGHWGVYASIDAEAELKEDWKVGLLFRVSKRLPRSTKQRLPIGAEPDNFGAEVGCVRINPGTTFNFLPYGSFENVRGGLGGRLMFTMTAHLQDTWTDRRCDRAIPVNLCGPESHSDWASSYVTLSVFYDFGKVKTDRGFAPILLFNWDLPASFLLRYHSAKTQMVSVGLEYNF